MRLFDCFLLAFTFTAPLFGGERVMFVGDSITHGVGSGSYRWALHRLWADNGMPFEVVGVHEGNHSGGIEPGRVYGGVVFNNRHSSICSERAYEIAGRINTSGRLGNTNIRDWLGLNRSYSGPYRISPSTQTPDLFLILIGTNDALGENADKGGIGAGENLETLKVNMLGEGGDMDRIISAVREANPESTIVVLSIPGWHDEVQPDNTEAADYAAVVDFNREYAAWAASRGVIFVDISASLRDYTRADKPGVAVPDFLQPFDHLHPSPQGDLLIAGAVAQKLSWPGATAGLPRRTLLVQEGTPRQMSHDVQRENDAFTCCVRLNMPPASGRCAGMLLAEICCGGGNLQVLDSGVRWGDCQMLLARQVNGCETFTIAYTPCETPTGSAPGYYVWLGNRLIGEALPANGDGVVDSVSIRPGTGVQAAAGILVNEACAPPLGAADSGY